MKFAGHTMGTPGKSLEEAMRLFSDIGFTGIELRSAPDGVLDTEMFSLSEAPNVRTMASTFGLEIVCLTPYFRDFIHDGKREHELASMRRVIDIAQAIECPNVRVYGGLLPKDPEDYAYYWDRTVSGIREIGRYAATRGITLCIETHGGSLTMAVADTVRMVEEIDLPNVGILFDYPWVSLAGKEGPREAVEMAAPYIKHVHVKDWTVSEDGLTRTTLLGEGDLDWVTVLTALKDAGYTGYLSDEYEKYWKEYLPEPEIGMKHDLKTLRTWVGSLGDRRPA